MKIDAILAYARGYNLIMPYRNSYGRRMILDTLRRNVQLSFTVEDGVMAQSMLCGALDADAGRAGADEAIFEVLA